jgi:hypothetical protein
MLHSIPVRAPHPSTEQLFFEPPKMVSMTEKFDYSSLKELLKGTTAEVLLPNDGEEYEKSIQRWSEHCTKRAVS